MQYPKLYLTIDNCFASKRWTTPMEWSKFIKDLGVTYIEASADTELDPLFMGEDYLKRWVEDVKEAEETVGVKVANLYSGHGTYATLGLTHTDASVRKRMEDQWFKPLITIAAQLGAGMGFFAHGFSASVLEDPARYNRYVERLYDGLSRLNAFAAETGCGNLAVEQMYCPHQIPWRIDGTETLLQTVCQRSGRDFYFTEDLGHHHIKFIRPTIEQIQAAVLRGNDEGLWLGTDAAYEVFARVVKGQAHMDALTAALDNTPHMFATQTDGDCYAWLSQLGCYSPIIHLQQTNGQQSAHLHFTEENNKKGIIDGKKALEAIAKSYNAPHRAGMPKKCDKIYLTMEAFAGTASVNIQTRRDYAKSIQYWRQFVPEDGMTLDACIHHCGG